MRLSFPCLLLLAASPALAKPLWVPGIDVAAPVRADYQCDQGALRVMYFNARNGQSFALLPVDGQPMLFVQTLSASGVRYRADHYVWWTKGENGNLYDETHGEDAAPIVGNCRSAPR